MLSAVFIEVNEVFLVFPSGLMVTFGSFHSEWDHPSFRTVTSSVNVKMNKAALVRHFSFRIRSILNPSLSLYLSDTRTHRHGTQTVCILLVQFWLFGVAQGHCDGWWQVAGGNSGPHAGTLRATGVDADKCYLCQWAMWSSSEISVIWEIRN